MRVLPGAGSVRMSGKTPEPPVITNTMGKYKEYKQLELPRMAEETSRFWERERIFEQSLETRAGHTPFVFYEGPPSANGVPGIHHVMARTIKDVFCRYKTLQGFQVERKAGWDTHGLPVELGVEKSLGITKEDIGHKISVEEYNQCCRKEVMKYKDLWGELTRKMGYWVNLDDPYITFDNKYIESVWYLLQQLYKKDLLYKGYSIQPYSPAAGTGLSTHELNQPGCYKNVKDNTLTAQFKMVRNAESEKVFAVAKGAPYFLAWTTTPWTLPSNTALCVRKDIDYVAVATFNPYTSEPITVLLCRDRLNAYFPEKNAGLQLSDYQAGDKAIPFEILAEFKGADLVGLRYEQLLPYAQPAEGDAFRVIHGDYVTTEDGTGIVHIAPSFGADDYKVAKQSGIGALTLVDKQGRFTAEMGEFAGRFVKPQYEPDFDPKTTVPVDVDIIVKLKKEGLAFKTEKYEHAYPHCWRTDKPILYYPLDSWFVRTTACKARMAELNKTIHWKPEATGSGRFGNWLENLVDWNLSRSRFWGIPLPIWATEDRSEMICIGSVAELKAEAAKAVQAGFMAENPLEAFVENDFSQENYNRFDLHRPYVDRITLVSPSGKPMKRESDLIDVWFDSGSMPYAQLHYPFENKEKFQQRFPADFIAEGVDQTRGWFFTLHAIATMVFDSVAYRNVVSNGLVLDKNGNKMSKRLGNAVDPFLTIDKYGPDATRWYMMTNAQPWDNLKFDAEGIAEVQRKFFGTLHNTYSFFALYANIDGFTYKEPDVPAAERPEIDRWILSELNTLIRLVTESYEDFEPTRAGRLIQRFIDEHLSNWYVRLSRRRFWKGDYTQDKISAYQTLYTCLMTVAKLASPMAPFFCERLYRDLNGATGKEAFASVHLSDFPVSDPAMIDKALETRMQWAQQCCSMVLSLRKRNNLRVRQPLKRIMIPVDDAAFIPQIESVRPLILSEVNVKAMELITETDILSKTIKPNFKALGPKYSKLMKPIAAFIGGMDQTAIRQLEKNGAVHTDIEGQDVEILLSDVEIFTEDIPGWAVANEGSLTVALDMTLDQALIGEGLSRELVNRIQNLRKDTGLEVTDRIRVHLHCGDELSEAVRHNFDYICSETLAETFELVDAAPQDAVRIELTETVSAEIGIAKF